MIFNCHYIYVISRKVEIPSLSTTKRVETPSSSPPSTCWRPCRSSLISFCGQTTSSSRKPEPYLPQTYTSCFEALCHSQHNKHAKTYHKLPQRNLSYHISYDAFKSPEKENIVYYKVIN